MTDTDIVQTVNGIDLSALNDMVEAIRADPEEGRVEFQVRTQWTGQTRSESTVRGCTLGGRRIERHLKIVADEPLELLGANTASNPQELLIAAVNACMTVGYVAGAAIRGILLEHLEIETRGELDLRGFLGLSDEVVPGYRQLDYVVRIRGSGTPEQFREIHDTVMRTSPNYFNMASAIRMNGELVLD